MYINDPSSNISDKHVNEPIHLFSPTAVPPYSQFITHIVKLSDQQASIFFQQELKIAEATERKKVVDAVIYTSIDEWVWKLGCAMLFGTSCELADRMKIVRCMRGQVVELTTNCYGTHVLQKALDSAVWFHASSHIIKLLIVSELLLGDPFSTLLNKRSAHVWSKIIWALLAPLIFA
ncbi:hypothetical protein JB92DRAFT_2829316 [Gautieria morchelliformis]|nr:hypothetical protein JB92DRAFT_2829316 [Gautieria morchelliformis]